jgi:eukaryotic-like serine/threonine-protein kinase
MQLKPGDKLGPYEITSAIGCGGMGEVWKARDTRLDRVVAIKTANAAFSERFEREARAVAALNHPHICTLYDVGPDYLVMEFVEGAEIKGPLPLDAALRYAIQLADAIDAAHRKGIVHRDLKPGNILLTKSGVKVLDFGLARIEAPGPIGASEETVTRALTQQGAIVGTLQYMAPEQLQGQPADARADIFSFGCVLYEMLTGKRAFDGASAASVIAAILERPAPSLTANLPAGLDWVLRLCLSKDPAQRWQSMHDVRAALERVAETRTDALPRKTATASRVPWIVAAAFAIAAAIFYLRNVGVAAPELRLDIATPPTNSPASFALSPDGRRIAFVATVDGVSKLWIRSLDSTTAQPVPATEGAINPFWAPDGRSVGYVAGAELKHVELSGGEPRTMAAVAPLGTRATWGTDDTIVVVTGGSIARMRASGQQMQPPAGVASGQVAHRAPYLLPGGKEFLFLANGSEPGLWLGSLDGRTPRRITAISPGADSAAEYLDPGWLFRVHQNSLVAQRFDRARASLSGEPITLAPAISVEPDSEAGAFSVSPSGAIAWRGGAATQRQLTWFDRTGHNLGNFGPADSLVLNPEISPDSQRVAFTRGRLDLSDVWIQDGSRSTRLTSDPKDDRIAVWSPDGEELIFASDRKGQMDLYRKRADGMASEEVLLVSSDLKFPTSWSPDRRFLLYYLGKNQGDVMVLPLTGDRKPYPFLSTQFFEAMGVFSPDGKWVAYESNESGQIEVYVRPFPGPGPPWQVSTGGGRDSRWSRDGKELYFLAPDSTLMASPITSHSGTFATGTPQALFRTHSIFAPGKQQYDVSRDGRFLIVTALEAPAEPIHLLLNWAPGR